MPAGRPPPWRPPSGVDCLTLSDGSHLDTGLLILAIGVKPETLLAHGAGLMLGPRAASRGGCGHAHLGSLHLRGGDAVGDRLRHRRVRADPAGRPRQPPGRIAADNMLGRSETTEDAGTAICKAVRSGGGEHEERRTSGWVRAGAAVRRSMSTRAATPRRPPGQPPAAVLPWMADGTARPGHHGREMASTSASTCWRWPSAPVSHRVRSTGSGATAHRPLARPRM